jgi:hypothetical protein
LHDQKHVIGEGSTADSDSNSTSIFTIFILSK